MSPMSVPRPTIAAWWLTALTPGDRAGGGARVAEVALDPLRPRIQVVRALTVRARQQRVEHPHVATAIEQRVDHV